MEQLPDNMRKTAEEFAANMRECFGESLRSVILYGPSAWGEEIKSGARITFMVVIGDNTPSELAPCTPYVKKWDKRGIAVPLFLTPEYIRDSLDTFPLEFMEMRSLYRVVYGEDVLKDLTFSDSDVRSECEREIKGKLLHLRTEYLALRGNWKGMADLIFRSLVAFRLVFAGALSLKRREVPEKTSDLLDLVAREFDLDAAFLEDLLVLARGGRKPDTAEADHIFDRYVEELDKLSNAIDTFTLSEE